MFAKMSDETLLSTFSSLGGKYVVLELFDQSNIFDDRPDCLEKLFREKDPEEAVGKTIHSHFLQSPVVQRLRQGDLASIRDFLKDKETPEVEKRVTCLESMVMLVLILIKGCCSHLNVTFDNDTQVMGQDRSSVAKRQEKQLFRRFGVH